MEEKKDKIQYPPYSRWYFSPKTTGEPLLFVEEIIVSTISPLIKKEPFTRKDIYFSIFRYGERIELKVFAPKEFSGTIQEIIESCKNSSIIIEPGEEGSYFCTANYCESTNQEIEARKFLKDTALICCDLYQNDLFGAIGVTVKYEFISNISENNRPDITKKVPEELKSFFRKNSPHYHVLEVNDEDKKFWEGFCYVYDGKTPWNHWYYGLMVGLEYATLEVRGIRQQIKLTCPDYLQYIQLYEKGVGRYIGHPQGYSCEEALAFHVNKLMDNH